MYHHTDCVVLANHCFLCKDIILSDKSHQMLLRFLMFFILCAFYFAIKFQQLEFNKRFTQLVLRDSRYPKIVTVPVFHEVGLLCLLFQCTAFNANLLLLWARFI